MRVAPFVTGLGLALALCGTAAADAKADRPATPKADADVVEARFADGSTMKLNLLDKVVVVNTRYGKLTVPTADIRRVEFALRIPDATARQIEAAVADLGGADATRHEAAAARLLEFRELAVPALQRAARAADENVAGRARDALKALQDSLTPARFNVKPHDTVVTADFAIAGQIEADLFKVRTPYFGDGQVRLHELRSLRSQAGDADGRVVVDAAKYAQQQEAWLDTGIDVARGSKLQLLASGTVDLWPIAPEVGKYLAGPDGMNNNAGGVGAVNMVVQGGWAVAPAMPAPPPPQPLRAAPPASGGTLLGRIGETGAVFVVGRKWEGMPAEQGRLYLRIVASPWNNPSTGTYDVRVAVEER